MDTLEELSLKEGQSRRKALRFRSNTARNKELQGEVCEGCVFLTEIQLPELYSHLLRTCTTVQWYNKFNLDQNYCSCETQSTDPVQICSAGSDLLKIKIKNPNTDRLTFHRQALCWITHHLSAALYLPRSQTLFSYQKINSCSLSYILANSAKVK